MNAGRIMWYWVNIGVQLMINDSIFMSTASYSPYRGGDGWFDSGDQAEFDEPVRNDESDAADYEDEPRDDFDHENRYEDKDPSPYDGDFSDDIMFEDGSY